MVKDRIEILLQLLAQGQATEADQKELYGFYLDPANIDAFNVLVEEWWTRDSFAAFLTKKESEALYRSIRAKIPFKQPQTVIARIKPWLVAASFAAAVGVGWKYLPFKAPLSPAKNSIAIVDKEPPAISKADLQMPDGKTAHLNLREGVVHADKIAAGNHQEGTYFTIANPRGSRSVLVHLPDGSKAWLNAESSLKYAAQFEHQRTVSVQGEVYFEVKHIDNQSFTVLSNGTEVKVLGTHFNVNTHDAETRVTLLEGLVQVKHDDKLQLLHPGEAAIVDAGLSVVKADTASVMAWKYELFDFKKKPITEIVQELSRWYDVDVASASIPADITMTGSVNRNQNISKVLELLSIGSGMLLKLEDGKITVKPKS